MNRKREVGLTQEKLVLWFWMMECRYCFLYVFPIICVILPSLSPCLLAYTCLCSVIRVHVFVLHNSVQHQAVLAYFLTHALIFLTQVLFFICLCEMPVYVPSVFNLLS